MVSDDGALIHNVFDSPPSVPVVITVHGKRKVIGSAHIEQGSDGVNISMDLDSSQPETAAIFLQNLSGLSISAEEVPMESPDPHTATDHEHKAYNHEDGLTDWCDICKLTAGFMRPRPDDWRKRMLES